MISIAIALGCYLWYCTGRRHGVEDTIKKYDEAEAKAKANKALDELAEETEKLGLPFK